MAARRKTEENGMADWMKIALTIGALIGTNSVTGAVGYNRVEQKAITVNEVMSDRDANRSDLKECHQQLRECYAQCRGN
jgi:hypothetical protein